MRISPVRMDQAGENAWTMLVGIDTGGAGQSRSDCNGGAARKKWLSHPPFERAKLPGFLRFVAPTACNDDTYLLRRCGIEASILANALQFLAFSTWEIARALRSLETRYQKSELVKGDRNPQTRARYHCQDVVNVLIKRSLPVLRLESSRLCNMRWILARRVGHPFRVST